MKTDNYYIAGLNTPSDWVNFSKNLVVGGSQEKWREAYLEYFRTRLELRYLKPIKVLQDNGTFQGEGFSIMTILCSLIEFLESTCQGKIYKYLPRGQRPGPNEYSSSKEMFKAFLKNREPFKNIFDDDLANEFYASIRCGLLHEASTKNGWRIWAKSSNGDIVNTNDKIIYRDQFEEGIRTFITSYGNLLETDKDMQKNFLIKWQSL
jgi:hypothetical protein